MINHNPKFQPYVSAKKLSIFAEMLTFREDDTIREHYMRDVVWGSFFYKYAGLWMLATDVLPNQFEQEINLFVYRDCNCAMEAWVGFSVLSCFAIPLGEFFLKKKVE